MNIITWLIAIYIYNKIVNDKELPIFAIIFFFMCMSDGEPAKVKVNINNTSTKQEQIVKPKLIIEEEKRKIATETKIEMNIEQQTKDFYGWE